MNIGTCETVTQNCTNKRWGASGAKEDAMVKAEEVHHQEKRREKPLDQP